MYSPNLFSGGFHDLWLQNQPSATFLTDGKKPLLNTSGQPAASQPQDEQRIQQLRTLFAPPLLAYSIETSGPNINQLDYLIRTKSLNGSKIPTNNLFSPLIVKNLNKLSSIGRLGYDTILPIGINKTMNDLEYEESKNFNFTDNSQMNQTNASMNQRFDEDNDEPPLVGNVSNSILEEEDEIDLDADIPDEDEELNNGAGARGASNRQTDVNVNGSVEDEGFMAEEVEYQDDHSISAPRPNELNIPAAVSTSSIISSMQRSENIENAENENENENDAENDFDRTEDESMDMVLE